MPTNYVIESGEKMLRVLQVLGDAPANGLQVSEIAARLNLKINFVFRALKTLEVHDFARQKKDGWKLGVKALALSDRLIDETEAS